MRLTIETEGLDNVLLLVKFLSENGFKIKSKDDPTLYCPAEKAAPEPSTALAAIETPAEVREK